ncbi:hypothetical protein Ddc_09970 [Ditylenchus destructor]|nr:hypothetical protein Ddc_09970 [Ditylenchus destructor]
MELYRDGTPSNFIENCALLKITDPQCFHVLKWWSNCSVFLLSKSMNSFSFRIMIYRSFHRIIPANDSRDNRLIYNARSNISMLLFV